MKKILSCFWIFMLLFNVALGEERFVTIRELRNEFQIENQYEFIAGDEEKLISVPVEIPRVDMLPVLKLSYVADAGYCLNSDEGWDMKVSKLTGSLHVSRGNTENQGADEEKAFFAPVRNEDVFGTTENYRQIIEPLSRILSQIDGINAEEWDLKQPDGTVYRQIFTSGAGQDDSHSFFMEFRQCFHGIPVFRHMFYYMKSTVANEVLSPVTGIFYSYRDMENLSFTLTQNQEVEVLAEDIPLRPFKSASATIREYIDRNEITAIYRISLGYVLYNEPGATTKIKQEHREYYAVPMWKIECFTKDSENKISDPESEEARLSNSSVVMLLDAQTGEMLDLESIEKDRSDYKGFISWDEVKK